MRYRSSSMKGLYHLALIVVCVTAFNGALISLVDINIVTRIFQDVSIPDPIMPIVICISAILVLWHNWVD